AVAPSTLFERLAAARKKLAARLRKRGFVGAAAALALSPARTLAAVPTSLLQDAFRVATGIGAGCSPALTLAQGVLKTMFLAKLKTLLSGCMLIAVLGLACAWSNAWSAGNDAPLPEAGPDKEPPKKAVVPLDRKAALAEAVRAALDMKA